MKSVMRIAVYCSSMEELPQEWMDTAYSVGKLLAQRGVQMVYGGVNMGLMRMAARGCKESGGTVVGIVPRRRAMVASPLNSVMIPTSDLSDRKSMMQTMADAFVVLPGGYGTLDEFASSFAYANFTRHTDKPVIVYNAEGLYDCLIEQLAVFVRRGLMLPEMLEILRVATTSEGLMEEIEGVIRGFKEDSDE